MKRLLITEEEKLRIKKLYNLLTEGKTPEEIKQEFKNAFPCYEFKRSYMKFSEENGVSYMTYFNNEKKGTYKMNLSGDGEYIDGPYVGRKSKYRCEGDKVKNEVVQKSQFEIDTENKLNNFPCITDTDVYRKTNDGKTLVSYENDSGGRAWYNLDDKTYFFKGGTYDGGKGKFECDGNKIKWGDVDQQKTSKKVTEKNTPLQSYKVTKEKPITYGMRDGDEEGLIYQIQKKLKELKLYTGEPDGQFGPKTYRAVIAFQKANKDSDGNPLNPDGEIGPKTIYALGVS